MSVFRLALVGAGRMGRTHARALAASSEVEIVCVVEPSDEAAALVDAPRATLADLPQEIHNAQPVHQLMKACARCMVDQQMTFTGVVECLEQNLLRQALADAGGNRTLAARNLGLSLSTLRDKLKRHGLDEGPIERGA